MLQLDQRRVYKKTFLDQYYCNKFGNGHKTGSFCSEGGRSFVFLPDNLFAFVVNNSFALLSLIYNLEICKRTQGQ